MVLKSGELVEMGNHEALLEQYPDGVYSGFCKKQESAEANMAADEQPDDTAARKKEKEDKIVEVDPVE